MRNDTPSALSSRRQPGGTPAQALFLIVIAAYLGVLIAGLGELSEDARLFPLMILGVCGVFLALKAISVASMTMRHYLEPDARSEPILTPPEETASRKAPGHRPAVVAWLWVAGAVASMYVVGLLAGTGASVLFYLRVVSGDSWRASVTVSAATLAFAYLVFVRAMHIELDFGLASRLF